MEKYSIKSIKDIGKLSPDGLLVYDLAVNKIEYCNKALPKILGTSSDALKEVNLKHIKSLVKDDETFLNQQLQLLKEKSRVTNLEIRLKEDRFISVDAYLIAKPQIS